jgi:hypothetical protein
VIQDKTTQLKTKLRTFIIYNTIGIGIMCYTVAEQYRNYLSNQQKLEILEYRTQNTQQDLNRINVSLNIINNAKKFSNEITNPQNIANGIQYKVAQEKLLQLISYYKIYPSSQFIASKQIEIPGMDFTSTMGNYGLVGSYLKFTINAGTDTQIIQFLDTMTRYFPGYLKLEYIRLKKVADIDSEIIADIKNQINRLTVTAEIGFEWYDFIKKN